MRIRTLIISLLAVCAVFAVSAVGATAASAACYKVAPGETGHWENNKCTVAGGTKQYVEVEKVEAPPLKPGIWCAKVKAGEPSAWSNNTCTTAHVGTGEFIKVMAMCYPVAEPKTGNFETSAKCENKEEKAASEWVAIEKLENEVEPGVWCAKVKVAKTGTFKNAACTEAEAKGEFIKVKVSLDEWEVCEEKAGAGTEPPAKYDEHKCNTQVKALALRKWEWKILGAGVVRKVVSEGGTFTLVAGGKTITCKKVKDHGTITGGKPGTDLAEEIAFTECTTGQAGCSVKSAGQANGTIVVTNIPTKLEQRLVGEEEILVDKFEQKEVEPGKFEFVTLKFEGTCSEYPETKVKGSVAAETVGSGELNFPNPELPGNTLEAFGVKATLTGKDTQAVVQAFTETVAQGWAVRAS